MIAISPWGGVVLALFHQPPPERETHGGGESRDSQRRRNQLRQLPIRHERNFLIGPMLR